MFRVFAPELARAFVFAPTLPRDAFNFSLMLNTPPSLKGEAARNYRLEGKSLSASGTQIRLSDATRSLQVDVLPNATGTGAPLKLRVTTIDETLEPKVFEPSLAELAKLQLPTKFKGLHAEMLRWLQESSPAMFGGLAGKESAASAAGASAASETAAAPADVASASHFEAPVEGDERGTPPAEQALRTYLLACDDAPDLRFEGRPLAAVVQPYRNGRSHAYSVFETKGKRIVAVKTGLSMWPTEQSRQDVKTLEKLEDVTSYFGFGSLAKALYDKLDLQTAVSVD